MTNNSCVICDEHKTLLGNLVSCVKGIYGSVELESFAMADKMKMIEILFEQFCLDKRTKFISSQKQQITNQINKERR